MIRGVMTRSQRKRQAERDLSMSSSESEYTPEDFKILKVLGKGGFGKVFQVRKETGSDRNQLYAMKVIRKSLVLSCPRNAIHMVYERNVLASTECPFLCHLHFAFQTNEKLYLVMEFLSGGDLFGHLERQVKLCEDDARFYLSEVVLALEYLHSRDIVYRDLKADNIMLDRHGHVKLADFGMCKENVNEKNKTYTRCGTAEYMAPEIITKGGYGKEADIWSLGTLMFDMLAGGPPFNGSSRKEIYENILTSKIRMPLHFSLDARCLVKQLLSRRVSKRITIEGLKKHDFFEKTDWKKVAALEVSPPFVPEFSNEEDVSLFSDEFTNMTPMDSPIKSQMTNPPLEDIFAGFSYTGEYHRMTPPTEETLKKVARKLTVELPEDPKCSTGDLLVVP